MLSGIIVIAMALFFGKYIGVFQRVPHQKTVKGTVVSVDSRYYPDDNRSVRTATVEYTVNDKVYSTKSQYKSSSIKIGEAVRVAYDRDNPQMALVRPQTKAWVAMIFMFVLGIVEICISFIK